MKKLLLLALAPLAMLGAPATAQTVVHTTVVHQNYRHYHGRGAYHTRRVCRMVWRHHHQVRRCRMVRYRRY